MEEKERVHLIDVKNIVVLYHAHCQDGFCGAWIAHKKFGETASYIPVKRGELLPRGLEGKEVYVIDFSYSKEDIIHAEQITQKFIVIDHHHSSRSDVESAKVHVFNEEFSGGYLAYQYFFPGENVPLFVQCISEQDTFLKRLPEYDACVPIVFTKEMTFENFDEFEILFQTEEGRAHLSALSEIVKICEAKILRPIVESIHFISFEGVTMPAVNATLPIHEKSLALHEIYGKYPPVALMYRFDDGEWKCSLRSNGDFDCTVIATKYGGGGHKGSAGFAVPGNMPLPFARVAEVSEIPEVKD